MLYFLLCVFIVVVTVCALPDALKAIEKLRGEKPPIDQKSKDSETKSFD